MREDQLKAPIRHLRRNVRYTQGPVQQQHKTGLPIPEPHLQQTAEPVAAQALKPGRHHIAGPVQAVPHNLTAGPAVHLLRPITAVRVTVPHLKADPAVIQAALLTVRAEADQVIPAVHQAVHQGVLTQVALHQAVHPAAQGLHPAVRAEGKS